MHPYDALKRIPRGYVTTYKSLGRHCRMHHRAVAMLMKHNSNPGTIPCYKVVMSNGRLGGYSGMKSKAALLRRDGIRIRNGVIDLSIYEWKFRK